MAQRVHQGALGHSCPDAGGAVGRGDEVLGAAALEALAVAVDEEGRGRGSPLGREAGLAGLWVSRDEGLEGASIGTKRTLEP